MYVTGEMDSRTAYTLCAADGCFLVTRHPARALQSFCSCGFVTQARPRAGAAWRVSPVVQLSLTRAAPPLLQTKFGRERAASAVAGEAEEAEEGRGAVAACAPRVGLLHRPNASRVSAATNAHARDCG